ncbi:ATP-binding protein [Streptomyces sp. NPDC002054]|uniref:ATP-binding protein n=1 Tax=Streptomyces sp. NPDC002054 TaxID=3154663 RepID=UPI003334155C
MVSEVVTNACMHAGGPRELVLRRTADRLRIEVSDGNPEPPRRCPRDDPAVPGGHGLLVLELLARSWGSAPSADGRGGKTVWLEVPCPPVPPVPPVPSPDGHRVRDRSAAPSGAAPGSG